MSLIPTNPDCPLCWANGKLAGGRVEAEGETFFLYTFRNEDNSLKYALIAPKLHYANPKTLPGEWGAEFSRCYGTARDLLNGSPHNAYWNDGEVAGQSILGHWHVRIEPRFEGQPSSGMGPAALVVAYNKVMAP